MVLKCISPPHFSVQMCRLADLKLFPKPHVLTDSFIRGSVDKIYAADIPFLGTSPSITDIMHFFRRDAVDWTSCRRECQDCRCSAGNRSVVYLHFRLVRRRSFYEQWSGTLYAWKQSQRIRRRHQSSLEWTLYSRKQFWQRRRGLGDCLAWTLWKGHDLPPVRGFHWPMVGMLAMEILARLMLYNVLARKSITNVCGKVAAGEVRVMTGRWLC